MIASSWEHLISIHGILKIFQMGIQLATFGALFLGKKIGNNWEITFGISVSVLLLLLSFATISFGIFYPVSFANSGAFFESIILLAWIVTWSIQYFSVLYQHILQDSHDDLNFKLSEEYAFLSYGITSIMMMSQIGITILLISKDVSDFLYNGNKSSKSLTSRSSIKKYEVSPASSFPKPVARKNSFAKNQISFNSSSSKNLDSSPPIKIVDSYFSCQNLNFSTPSEYITSSVRRNVDISLPESRKNVSSIFEYAEPRDSLVILNKTAAAYTKQNSNIVNKSSMIREYSEEDVKEKYETPRRRADYRKEEQLKKNLGNLEPRSVGAELATVPKIISCIAKSEAQNISRIVPAAEKCVVKGAISKRRCS